MIEYYLVLRGMFAMEGILAYMVSDLVRQNRVAGVNDLKKMIWTIVASMNLGDVVKDVLICEEKTSSHLACFYFYHKFICLYSSSLEEHLEEIRMDCKSLGLSSRNTLYVQNLSLLQTCMHEVCHAYQLKLFHKKFKIRMKEQILTEFLTFFASSNEKLRIRWEDSVGYRELYLETYELNPLEVQANQVSTNLVLKVLDFASIHNPIIHSYFKRHLYQFEGIPYKEEGYPLKKIAQKLGHYQKLKKYIENFECYQSLSLDEKMMFRFPLNKQEKDEFNRKVAFINKKLRKKN